MTRLEFFSVIYRRGMRGYFVILLVCLIVAIVSRVVNSEQSLLFSTYTLLIVFPAYVTVIFSGISRVFDLHKKENGKVEDYVAPGFLSIKLAPYSLVVSIVILGPPVLLIAALFGLESHVNEHTTTLSMVVLLNLVPVWYFSGVHQLFRKWLA